MQPIPSPKKNLSAVRSRESVIARSAFLPNITSKIAACVCFRRLLHLIPTESEHILWNQS